MQRAHMASGGRYPVLRAIAILLLVGGFLELVAGVVGSIWWCRTHPVDTAGNLAVVVAAILAGAFLSFLATVALSELIKLFIDIEHHSRMAVGAAAVEATAAVVGANGGGDRTRTWIAGEETAEGALIRGH